ncbi:MAG: iron-sulfur cluster assembly scaffold protein [Mesorhizobium sp.]|uniref:iron-sulfur cluster assembly scaffold protein n=1 Tax=Mesorhizobium sp. TaxID=1871066 RepID=UPI00120C2B28|nr:iron-sulfur cluster assembly scaffold protein [Mesorhizobium sp.]TIN32160.1 MAG: iron-sulfur cluster assembly scaffold protein [Mesorhizobium sp.]TJU83115.1 MAG: iron-sulfur cluster assembly scaffold protein [Mesorhizobium sp.]
MWNYSEYFVNPNNVGAVGTANAVGEVGAIACGDSFKLILSIDPKTETITGATFQTFGCGSAIVASPAFGKLIVGKTIDEALQITYQDIADFLGVLQRQTIYSPLDRLLLERGLRLMSELFHAVKQAFEETPGFSRFVLVQASSA